MKRSDLSIKKMLLFFMLSTFLAVPVLLPPVSGFSTSTSVSFPSTEFILPNVHTLGYSFSSQSVIDSSGTVHIIYTLKNSTGVYLDPTTYEVMYLCNQTGSWSTPVSIFTSDTIMTCSDIQVNSQNDLHVSINVDGTGNRYLFGASNGTWTDDPIGTLGGLSAPAVIAVDSSDQTQMVYTSTHPTFSSNLYIAYRNYSSVFTSIQNSTFIDDVYNTTENSSTFVSTIFSISNFTSFPELSSIHNPHIVLDNRTAHIIFEADWDKDGQFAEKVHDVFYTSYVLHNYTTSYDESVNFTEVIENSTYIYQVNSTYNISTTRGHFTDFVCLSASLINRSATFPNIVISPLGNLHVAWIQETNNSLWEIVYQTYGSLPLPPIFEGVPQVQQQFNITLITDLEDLTMAIDCPSSDEVLHFLIKGNRNSPTNITMEETSELLYIQNSSGNFCLEKISNSHKYIGDTSFYIHPSLHTAGITYLSTPFEESNDYFGDSQGDPLILRLIEQRGSDFGVHFSASALVEGKYISQKIKTIASTDNSTKDVSIVSIEDGRKSVLLFALQNAHNQSRDFNMNLEFQPNNLIQLSSSPEPDSPQYSITQMSPLENRTLEWEFLLGEGVNADLAVQFYSSEIFLGEFVFHVEIEIRFKVSITIFIFGGLLLIFSGLYWHYQKKF
ncbi:MAG: hypothetical protein ACTSWW_04680 [Promethearchaeota archaeon]